jgi:ssDNA-binding Zn-finger/Zn-ribbon topoisomerase 1
MVRIESPDFAKSISAEYQYRRESKGGKALSNISRTLKKGDKCDQPGCTGLIREIPAGKSKTTGRQYPAFLSCSNYPKCKTT